MCGRFRQTRAIKYLLQQFNAELAEALANFDDLPRVNIAPTQEILTVKQGKGKTRTLTTMRWGLIPAWAKDPKIGNRNINARSEGIRETPSFRDLVGSRRCLIPADGFYEWKKTGKVKQPYCFEITEGDGLFAFAGLWDTWKNPQGQIIESCTILTTTPNELVAQLHDRMPVIIPPTRYETWLNPSVEDFEAVREILRPFDSASMQNYPVNQRMNNPANDDPASAAPIVLEAPPQRGLF